jgi:D-alanine-D-alanine ligase
VFACAGKTDPPSSSHPLADLGGYARIDFRLTADGIPYFIEANPNPEIAKSQEFATAAREDGLDYPNLLHRILALGISRAKAGASVG